MYLLLHGMKISVLTLSIFRPAKEDGSIFNDSNFYAEGTHFKIWQGNQLS